MLGCPELVELVTEYVEGALTPERHHEVHEHLLECADCLRYLGQVALTSQLLATLPAPELTSELEAQLARDFRTASERPGPPRVSAQFSRRDRNRASAFCRSHLTDDPAGVW